MYNIIVYNVVGVNYRLDYICSACQKVLGIYMYHSRVKKKKDKVT